MIYALYIKYIASPGLWIISLPESDPIAGNRQWLASLSLLAPRPDNGLSLYSAVQW